MQEFGRLSMLSDYFLWSGHAQKRLCGSHDPVHLLFGTIWWEMLKIVYPSIPSYHYIVMTNNSNQHVKVTKNQTLGMLKSCDQDQICTIHRLVTFEPKSLGGKGITPNQTKQSHDNNIENETVTKDFYQIPTRKKHGEIEVLTVL